MQAEEAEINWLARTQTLLSLLSMANLRNSSAEWRHRNSCTADHSLNFFGGPFWCSRSQCQRVCIRMRENLLSKLSIFGVSMSGFVMVGLVVLSVCSGFFYVTLAFTFAHGTSDFQEMATLFNFKLLFGIASIQNRIPCDCTEKITEKCRPVETSISLVIGILRIAISTFQLFFFLFM